MNISQTDKNRYIQECGAKNEHQTWGLFEAQSLFTEWMCEWSRDFHERQLGYWLDWNEKFGRDGNKIEEAVHQTLKKEFPAQREADYKAVPPSIA